MVIIKTEESTEKKKYQPGLKSEGPYYDPEDIHVHRWVKGNICGQKSHQKNIITGKKQNARYCEICHEIDNNIITTSTKITSMYDINSIPMHNTTLVVKKKDIFCDVDIIDSMETPNSESTGCKKIAELSESTISNILGTDLFMMYENSGESNKIMFQLN